MKIKSLRIQNFRSFSDETIEFDQYTCLVGPNGAGKSTVLAALNVFFRNSGSHTSATSLSDQDFHKRNTADPVRITVTFSGLSPAAKEDLKAYVRQDQLVVTAQATWDATANTAPVQQFGSRMVMEDFATYFQKDKGGALAPELKSVYAELRERYPDLPSVRSKADMADALQAYEESHQELCRLMESPDQFYGFTKGVGRIEPHCQWVCVPAVKDASEEEREGRNTALGQLLERTVRRKVSFGDVLKELREEAEARYKALLDAQDQVLDTISEGIQARLQEWAHPGARVRLHWDFDPSRSVQITDPTAKANVGEGDFLGDLARLGHGLQRSFIVAVLHELATAGGAEGPTLILGLEEPELYQHPPQARHLATVLERLAQDGAQVVASTHSPYLVSGRGVEAIRMVRKHRASQATKVSGTTHARLSARLAEVLGGAPATSSTTMATVEQILQPSQNEMFFSRVPILVEGIEDVAFISTHLHLSQRWDDFRRLGCHFVVAEGKNKLSRPLAIACLLDLPAFTVLDADTHKAGEEEDNRRDNGCILKLAGLQHIDPIPDDHVFHDSVVMWKETIGRAIRADFPEGTWNSAEQEARARHQLRDGVKQKNTLIITGTLEVLFERQLRSALLDRVCDHILTFAEKAHN